MLVDEDLLHDADDCTDDPVQAHAAGQGEAEDGRHGGHHEVHGLHGLRSLVIGVGGCLGHQLDIEPLCKCSKEGNDERDNDHDPAPAHNVGRRLSDVESQEIVVLVQLCGRRGDIVAERRQLPAQAGPVRALELVQNIDEVVLDRVRAAGLDIGRQLLGKLGGAGKQVLAVRVLGQDHLGCGIQLIELVHQREKGVLDQGKVGGNVVENAVQGEQDGHLDDELDTAACRGDAVLVVDLPDFLLLGRDRVIVLPALVFFLDLVDLRLHFALQLGKLLLTDRERQHGHVDQDRHNNDGKSDIRQSDIPQKIKDQVHDIADEFGYRTDNESRTFGQKHGNQLFLLLNQNVCRSSQHTSGSGRCSRSMRSHTVMFLPALHIICRKCAEKMQNSCGIITGQDHIPRSRADCSAGSSRQPSRLP